MRTAKTYGIRVATSIERGFLLLSIGAGITTLQEAAFGRDGRVVAAAAGARWGYNRAVNENDFGYWYAPTPSQPGTGTKSVSSLPSGYLERLPDGAVPVVIFGKTYYFANGNDYSPVIYGGRTVYVIANP